MALLPNPHQPAFVELVGVWLVALALQLLHVSFDGLELVEGEVGREVVTVLDADPVAGAVGEVRHAGISSL